MLEIYEKKIRLIDYPDSVVTEIKRDFPQFYDHLPMKAMVISIGEDVWIKYKNDNSRVFKCSKNILTGDSVVFNDSRKQMDVDFLDVQQNDSLKFFRKRDFAWLDNICIGSNITPIEKSQLRKALIIYNPALVPQVPKHHGRDACLYDDDYKLHVPRSSHSIANAVIGLYINTLNLGYQKETKNPTTKQYTIL